MVRPIASSGPPPVLHTALELRAPLELALLGPALPLLLMAPRGDGHPVLLVPGFLSSEVPLLAMQAFLLEPNAPYKTGIQRIDQTVELLSNDGWSSSGPVNFYETFDLSTAPGLAPYRFGCARAEGARLY